MKLNRGFSLIEALIATAILGTILISVMMVLYSSQSTTINGIDAQRALRIARNGLVLSRITGYDDWGDLQDGTWGLSIGSFSWGFTAQPTIYDNFFTHTVTIETLGDTDIKKITSLVIWGTNPEREIELTMTISRWKELIP